MAGSVAPLPHALKLVEGVTHQRVSLRLDPEEIETVGEALELFRLDPEVLIARGQLTPELRWPFLELGECLFTVDASGELGELHQWLRLVQAHEQVSPEAPLAFERRPLPGGGEVMLAELTLDRRECLYDRDWAAFHRRKLTQAKAEIEAFLRDAALTHLDPEEARRALSRETEADRERLLWAAARQIHAAPFELYSRFVGRRRLIKDGVATLRSIVAGHGGACSEKAQAVRLVADALEIPAQYIFCGPNTRGEVPTAILMNILETFEAQHSAVAQSFWNHLALLVELDGRELLVDAAAGNIPFLWAEGDELRAMLDQAGQERLGLPHRYVVGSDQLFYHRVDQQLAERLLFALELGWADPHIDLVQALDDELGLMVTTDLWLGAAAYANEEELELIHQWYQERWIEPGLVRGVVFTRDLVAAVEPLAEELRAKYPLAAAAATEALPYLESRLEEANPGEGYRAELILVGRYE